MLVCFLFFQDAQGLRTHSGEPHTSERRVHVSGPALDPSFDAMGEREALPEILVKCAACEETQKLCDHYKKQIGNAVGI